MSRKRMKGSNSENILQVFDANNSDTVQEFTDLLLGRILSGYGVKVHRISRANDVSGDVPLMVICHNYSRIGTDIDAAMAGVPAGSTQNTVVVVLHVTQPHAQPAVMPTETLSTHYHEFGHLVDYAYTSEQKIYTCEMNKIGDEKMHVFLKRHFKRRGRICDGKCLLVCLVAGVVLIGAGFLAVYYTCPSFISVICKQ